jgi:tungstate transport system permease protein
MRGSARPSLSAAPDGTRGTAADCMTIVVLADAGTLSQVRFPACARGFPIGAQGVAAGRPKPAPPDIALLHSQSVMWKLTPNRADCGMDNIIQGLAAALRLIATGDRDLAEIALRSLQVTVTATLIASALALPLGAWLTVRRFRFRRGVIAVLNALMGLPPVVVGLVVYLLLSRSGPLGVLGLLFTPTAMIIAQVIIITPLIASIAHQSLREIWAAYHDLLISMNTSRRQRIATLLWDGRRALITASLAGFGRAIGEVGAIMIVGGNIDHVTRVLTTAIALETARGDFALALALGFVLIGLAVAVNLSIHMIARTERARLW